MTRHEWRDTDAEGQKWLYRANVHHGEWHFYRKAKKRDPEWENCDDLMSIEELESFRETLWNKHLRRRVALKHVEQIDLLLEKRRSDEEEW